MAFAKTVKHVSAAAHHKSLTILYTPDHGPSASYLLDRKLVRTASMRTKEQSSLENWESVQLA